ncbi:16S rRNA (uracil(1498)-N(3))-methyltransferase [Dichelobacter nodosus]|uniref:Ribosomal RNA small subunit methyltransferase E n=1 Tax=Dichelobacter nodosus (strain VCS1703A) TaxID=246195 RepID=A5EVW4_DICNV|nr:16S rRNA (uracil(1498)-N(3))-methyltransferase [Dichelobacter nodosus]ABQ13439.1 conserved hypothetical protein [Dichelobacter nodosus VCS1703A]AXM45320.1 16S rRNA (uracil(1498)-N(3))-methyltransferase [Dichelobacter nodosus]KNZ40065.1 hypothetical protein AKG33_00375 [Dichelobacter nodosus]TGA65065.1 16S rRNA (uracil(1498)-N(3))-methyltransferase [Dichelobacter nodosus]
MRDIRLLCEGQPAVGEAVALSDVSHHHALKVLRLRENDAVDVICGDGYFYHGEITCIDRKQTLVRVYSRSEHSTRPKTEVILLPALLKGEPMDWVLQKSVELGVRRVIPMNTERSERRIEGDRLTSKYEHWQGILQASALQCGRAEWPLLSLPMNFIDALKTIADEKWILSPHDETTPAIKEMPSSIALMVGPEGGFSEDEVQSAVHMGWKTHCFGSRILRADTASVVAVVKAQLLLGAL